VFHAVGFKTENGYDIGGVSCEGSFR